MTDEELANELYRAACGRSPMVAEGLFEVDLFDSSVTPIVRGQYMRMARRARELLIGKCEETTDARDDQQGGDPPE